MAFLAMHPYSKRPTISIPMTFDLLCSLSIPVPFFVPFYFYDVFPSHDLLDF